MYSTVLFQTINYQIKCHFSFDPGAHISCGHMQIGHHNRLRRDPQTGRKNLHIRLPSRHHVRTPSSMECRLKYGAPLTNLSCGIVPRGAEPRATTAAAASPPPQLSGRIESRPFLPPLPTPALSKLRSANQLSAEAGDQYAILAVLWTPMRQTDGRQSLPRERRICVWCVCERIT